MGLTSNLVPLPFCIIDTDSFDPAAAGDDDDDDDDIDVTMNTVLYRRTWMKGHSYLESSTS